MKRIAQLVVPILLAFAGVAHAATPAVPIGSTGPTPTLPTFIGHAAVAHPVSGVGVAWQDPFMAPNPSNSVHNDAWASDDYTGRSGPLGRRLTTFSTAIGRDCITLTFNHQGQLIGTCTDLSHGPGLYLLDPNTLATLAFLQLPFVPPPAGTNPATNTTGGAYFYLDNHDRAVLAASNRHILVVALVHHNGTPAFRTVASYDPTPCLTAGDRMPSVLPDAQGGCGSSVATRAPSACSIRRPVTAARSSCTRRSRTRSRSGATAPTSSPTRRCTSSAPARICFRRSSGRAATATRVPRRWASSTPGRGRRRHSSVDRRRAPRPRRRSTSRSPTTRTRSTSSCTARRIDSAPTSIASSARCRCSARARAATRTR